MYELFRKCKSVILTNSNHQRQDVTSVKCTEQISSIALDYILEDLCADLSQDTSYPDRSFMVFLSPSRQITGFTLIGA